MKIIVTHAAPDLDAITSVWLIKRYLPDWHDAAVEFVPAGNRTPKIKNPDLTTVIEKTENAEFIHVDTGLGPLDHHQTDDQRVCGASRTWDYIQQVQSSKFKIQTEPENWDVKRGAIDRIVKIIVEYDHFREVFWENPTADYHEFSLGGILEGLQLQKPDQDDYAVEFISACLDAMVHNFQNRIWAEKTIEKQGKEFKTTKGKGIAFETINDSVVKLSQKMGYMLVIRKDPRKGYVRIKARPDKSGEEGINLTLVYEKLRKMDPDATWFLHVSKKMLLNGSVKNPSMKPTSLSLDDIIKAVEGSV